MNKKIIIVAVLAVFIAVMLSGCIPGDGKATIDRPANFLWGIWHGWIAPISVIVGIFNKSIRVYESVNTGWWYDFGFYIAVISGFGSLSLFRRKKHRVDRD